MLSKPSAIDTASLVKTIGARLRAARELCNLSQAEAARRLGYRNSSKLSKVENATDTNSVPLAMIFRAAKLYEVSADYLFGLTDDWETDARLMRERAISGWLFETWECARARDMETLRRLHNKLDAMEGVIGTMIAASDEAKASLDQFAELNAATFEDMPAGNRLVWYVNRAADAAQGARQKMKKFHAECKVAVGVSRPLAAQQLILQIEDRNG